MGLILHDLCKFSNFQVRPMLLYALPLNREAMEKVGTVSLLHLAKSGSIVGKTEERKIKIE